MDHILSGLFLGVDEYDKNAPMSELFMANMNVLLEHVKRLEYEAAFKSVEALYKNAKANNLAKQEMKFLKEIRSRIKLIYKARKSWGVSDGQMPPALKNVPSLSTINGIGTMLYGNTQYIVVAFLPVLPLERYAVLSEGGNSYSFHGSLPLNKFQKVWKWAVLGIIGAGLLYAAGLVIYAKFIRG